MCKPPKKPLTIEGKSKSYFEYLAELVSPYLKEYNVILSFKGYSETLNGYSNISSKSDKELCELANDLNAWTEYMTDLSSLIQKILLDSETEKIQTIAIASINADAKKVSAGDRIANKENSVVAVRKKRNTLKAFYTAIEEKANFLERAYHHCKQIYDCNIKLKLENRR
ncbi:hypothetical protein BFS06_12005 [Clostridium perfringens]|uniref:Uncharacterized protein n=1 Tax=Clostridium perfringens TaxID=1502 RepID=A0A140GQW9_CLOPF|nr:hypothetical protein [Clostridium perfringens]AMN30928.1 hypothetical protein JFP838_pA0012 [Clostridium perfringens]TBX14926.1 hypothetical protein BFS06_12005 [Clostridium perfringens]